MYFARRQYMFEIAVTIDIFQKKDILSTVSFVSRRRQVSRYCKTLVVSKLLTTHLFSRRFYYRNLGSRSRRFSNLSLNLSRNRMLTLELILALSLVPSESTDRGSAELPRTHGLSVDAAGTTYPPDFGGPVERSAREAAPPVGSGVKREDQRLHGQPFSWEVSLNVQPQLSHPFNI